MGSLQNQPADVVVSRNLVDDLKRVVRRDDSAPPREILEPARVGAEQEVGCGDARFVESLSRGSSVVTIGIPGRQGQEREGSGI